MVALKIQGANQLSNPVRERVYCNRFGVLLDATQTGALIAVRTAAIPGIAISSASKAFVR